MAEELSVPPGLLHQIENCGMSEHDISIFRLWAEKKLRALGLWETFDNASLLNYDLSIQYCEQLLCFAGVPGGIGTLIDSKITADFLEGLTDFLKQSGNKEIEYIKYLKIYLLELISTFYLEIIDDDKKGAAKPRILEKLERIITDCRYDESVFANLQQKEFFGPFLQLNKTDNGCKPRSWFLYCHDHQYNSLNFYEQDLSGQNHTTIDLSDNPIYALAQTGELICFFKHQGRYIKAF